MGYVDSKPRDLQVPTIGEHDFGIKLGTKLLFSHCHNLPHLLGATLLIVPVRRC